MDPEHPLQIAKFEKYQQRRLLLSKKLKTSSLDVGRLERDAKHVSPIRRRSALKNDLPHQVDKNPHRLTSRLCGISSRCMRLGPSPVVARPIPCILSCMPSFFSIRTTFYSSTILVILPIKDGANVTCLCCKLNDGKSCIVGGEVSQEFADVQRTKMLKSVLRALFD